MQKKVLIINSKGTMKLGSPRDACMSFMLKNKRYSSKAEVKKAFSTASKFCAMLHY